MKKRWPNKPRAVEAPPNVRYAIVDKVHQEVLSANHTVIGEAFNSKDESFYPFCNPNLIVVATFKDEILGEVTRKGQIKVNKHLILPKTIWSGPRHCYFDPTTATKL